MASKHTQRALMHARAQGWDVTIVEQWIPQARKRRDAFGFADLLVIDGKEGTLYVQVTSRSNMASRRKKILDLPVCKRVLRFWNRIEVWGFDQPKGKGTRWREKIVPVTLEDFDND